MGTALSDDTLVSVSPRHSVRLAQEYLAIVERPRRDDFVIRTVSRKQANGLPLMSAEIVIAGHVTRAAFSLAERYPVHFRKTHFPGHLHGDPRVEFERHRDASQIIDIPEPIGFDERTFRACLLPGTPLEALSPFHGDPEDIHLRQARELSLAAAAGHWKLTEHAFESLSTLHRGGLVHGDAVLQNFVVCPSPLEILPIDFESSARRDALPEDEWKKRAESDLDSLLTHAVYLMCALGPQPGALAEMALGRMERLLKVPDRFRRAIEQRSDFDG
jgi:hypothetical protein